MVTIRLSAAEVRTIRTASEDPTSVDAAAGVYDLILDKIAEAEQEKTKPKSSSKYTVRDAIKQCKTTLGSSFTLPQKPDSQWFSKIQRVIDLAGMDNMAVNRLALHAKQHMRLPIAFDFLICQHERVLAGEWDRVEAPKRPPDLAGLPRLPDE